MPMRFPRLVAVLLLLGVVGSQRAAFAYLDPTSGSMLLQVLLGGFAGLAVAARLIWRRISGRSKRPAPVDEQPPI